MLLNDIGLHIQLNRVNKDKSADLIFPFNTSSDVIMDEHGNVLADYIPTLVKDDGTGTNPSPIFARNLGEEEDIDDTILEKILADEPTTT